MRTRSARNAKVPFRAAALLLGSALLALLACSCSQERPDQPAAPQVRIKSALKADLYERVELTVSGPGFQTVDTGMRQEADAWVADIAVAPGPDRRFLVEVFAGGRRLYRGETVVDVLPEPVLDLELAIRPVATLMAVTPHLLPATLDSSFTVTVGITGLPEFKRAVFGVDIYRALPSTGEFPVTYGHLTRPASLPRDFSWYDFEGYVDVDCVECLEPVDIYQGRDFAPLAEIEFGTFDNWGPAVQELLAGISLEVVEDFAGNSYTSESIYLDRAAINLTPPPVRDTVTNIARNQKGNAIAPRPTGGYMVAGSYVLPEGPVDPHLGTANYHCRVISGYTWGYYWGEAVGIVPSGGSDNYVVAMNTDMEGQTAYVAMVSAGGGRIWGDWWNYESQCQDVCWYGSTEKFAVVGSETPYLRGKFLSPRLVIATYDLQGQGDYLVLEGTSPGEYQGGCQGFGITWTLDDHFAVCGVADTLGANGPDLYLAKVDEAGNAAWETYFGGSGYEIGRKLTWTADGGLAAVGSTDSYGAGSYDVLLVKVNSSGEVRWWRTFGGSGRDEGYDIAPLEDGGFLIVGETTSFGAKTPDAYIIRTNSRGELVWQRNLGGSLADGARGLTWKGIDSFAVIGYTTTVDFGEDFMAWYIDAHHPPNSD